MLEQRRAFGLRSVLCLVAVSSVASCGPATNGSSPTTQASPSAEATLVVESSPTPDQSHPVGVIAMGHSGLTGEGTGGEFEAVFENSWATGTSDAVNSIYRRLWEVLPDTKGHVANTASGGASASALADQTVSALFQVPVPALAIVSTIDNDIRCDGTDAEHVAAFGTQVAKALDLIKTASPNAKILVVGQFGRPRPEFVRELVAYDPSVKPFLIGDGICDFFDPDGNLVEANFATLTDIIELYEAAQARVCDAIPNCVTDGGVRARYVDKLDNFAPDWAHLNVTGQAEEAEIVWPVVADLFGQ